MNRLIIVGNGFDKAHGLNSDYNSFIKSFLIKSFGSFKQSNQNSYSDGIIEISKKRNSDLVPSTYNTDEEIFTTINELIIGNYAYNFTFLTKFAEEICTDAELKWVDIERAYYKHLILEFNKIKDKEDLSDDDFKSINSLNNQMKILGESLDLYLQNENKKYNNSDVDNQHVSSALREKEFEAKIWNKIPWKNEAKNLKEPEKVMIANFNYTNPFRGSAENIDVVNIHGKLKNTAHPIVFGYGDERDDNYKELEKAGNDVLLKYIKSFAYFQNNEYQKLLGFIESGEFEVWIVGHSCGVSDKTLLAQIFEHDFCKNIRVYHYRYEDKDGNQKDNYNEIVYNIARVMSNKIKMRSIVCHKYGQNEFSNVAGIIDNC